MPFGARELISFVRQDGPAKRNSNQKERSKMKLLSLKKSIGTVLVGTVIAASGLAYGEPDSDDEGNTCTVARIKGSYGFSQLGSIVGIAPTPIPAADVGVFHADGKGNLTGSEVVNVGGQIFSDTFTDGKYEVNPDCTGTATWIAVFSDGRPSQTRTARLVVTNKFREIHILSTAPGTVLVGIARKQ